MTLIHPQFDPVAIAIGPVSIHWYGLMYLMAFAQFLLLGNLRLKQAHIKSAGLTYKDLEDILFAGVAGVILGGRLGYILFYMPSHYLAHPLDIFKVWEGGMSFHGGFLGVLVAMWWSAKKHQKTFFEITDLIAPLIPVGLAFGRLGNFINGELWGRPTDLPWAMIFPQAGDLIARHPSQLYQLAGEGLCLALMLWWYASTPRKPAQVSGFFLLGYGVFRFLAEFAREPDNFLGLLSLGLSMGQWLSIPMIIMGIVLVFKKYQ
jgi:phosphatidylglycerol---prolipoprotein diacylglyceryl transferase